MANFFDLQGAPESPFDNSPIFERNSGCPYYMNVFGEYQTENIDFVKLAAFLRQKKDTEFNYIMFLGHRSIIVPRFSNIGDEKKVNPLRNLSYKEQKALPTTIPLKNQSKTLNIS